jgi:penicillin-binding protein 1A
MAKWIFLLLFAVSLFIGYDSYRPYLPPPVAETIQQLAGGRFWEETMPPSVRRLYNFFHINDEIRRKMAAPDWIKLKDINLGVQQAIISVEDSRFYQHGAFDISGILRAVLVNLQAGEIIEGGSTITQQVAKNLFLTQEQTFARKAEEAIYGLIIESGFSKEEILEVYLNTIYFGAGAYGIKAAAQIYFQTSPARLTMAQSSLLAGLPAAPSVYSPFENLDAAKKRQAVVLETMVKNGFIGPQKARELLAEKLF